jgi:predicted  nucleic acid-binding Zn-ribbon protein
VRAEPAPAPARTRAPEGPNVLGTAIAGAKNLAMVAKAELDREIARTHNAQKEAASYRKQIEDLNRQLADARAQIVALQRANVKMPPPASDQEQILQMLAPVLRSSNDGRP